MTFIERTLAWTGSRPENLPLGSANDVLCGHIVAYDEPTNTFVVFVGYPEVDDDGQQWWDLDDARIIRL
jgi:hypothetical protein